MDNLNYSATVTQLNLTYETLWLIHYDNSEFRRIWDPRLRKNTTRIL